MNLKRIPSLIPLEKKKIDSIRNLCILLNHRIDSPWHPRFLSVLVCPLIWLLWVLPLWLLSLRVGTIFCYMARSSTIITNLCLGWLLIAKDLLLVCGCLFRPLIFPLLWPPPVLRWLLNFSFVCIWRIVCLRVFSTINALRTTSECKWGYWISDKKLVLLEIVLLDKLW